MSAIIFVLDLEVTTGLTITHSITSPSYTELRHANQELLGRDMYTLIRGGMKTDVRIVLRRQVRGGDVCGWDVYRYDVL